MFAGGEGGDPCLARSTVPAVFTPGALLIVIKYNNIPLKAGAC
jgi:hypothetical protein